MSPENKFVWGVYSTFFRALITVSGGLGSGGWSFNVEGFKMIVEESGVEDKLIFMKRLLLLAEILMKQEKPALKEPKGNNPSPKRRRS